MLLFGNSDWSIERCAKPCWSSAKLTQFEFTASELHESVCKSLMMASYRKKAQYECIGHCWKMPKESGNRSDASNHEDKPVILHYLGTQAVLKIVYKNAPLLELVTAQQRFLHAICLIVDPGTSEIFSCSAVKRFGSVKMPVILVTALSRRWPRRCASCVHWDEAKTRYIVVAHQLVLARTLPPQLWEEYYC